MNAEEEIDWTNQRHYTVERSNLGNVRLIGHNVPHARLEGQRADITWYLHKIPWPTVVQAKWWQWRLKRRQERARLAHIAALGAERFETLFTFTGKPSDIPDEHNPSCIQLAAREYVFTKTQNIYSGLKITGTPPEWAKSMDMEDGKLLIEGATFQGSGLKVTGTPPEWTAGGQDIHRDES